VTNENATMSQDEVEEMDITEKPEDVGEAQLTGLTEENGTDKPITLYDCRVARRGKNASGTIAIQSIGIPVVEKDEETGEEITRSWTYEHIQKMGVNEFITKIENLRLPFSLVYAFSLGIDYMLRSEAQQNQSRKSLLMEYLLESDLAENPLEAGKLATAWQGAITNNRNLGLPVPTLDELTAARKKIVDAKKALGQWKPRLVKKVEEETK
jgi:hypothetical protein